MVLGALHVLDPGVGCAWPLSQTWDKKIKVRGYGGWDSSQICGIVYGFGSTRTSVQWLRHSPSCVPTCMSLEPQYGVVYVVSYLLLDAVVQLANCLEMSNLPQVRGGCAGCWLLLIW